MPPPELFKVNAFFQSLFLMHVKRVVALYCVSRKRELYGRICLQNVPPFIPFIFIQVIIFTVIIFIIIYWYGRRQISGILIWHDAVKPTSLCAHANIALEEEPKPRRSLQSRTKDLNIQICECNDTLRRLILGFGSSSGTLWLCAQTRLPNGARSLLHMKFRAHTKTRANYSSQIFY